MSGGDFRNTWSVGQVRVSAASAENKGGEAAPGLRCCFRGEKQPASAQSAQRGLVRRLEVLQHNLALKPAPVPAAMPLAPHAPFLAERRREKRVSFWVAYGPRA